jgi:hypothetical protein
VLGGLAADGVGVGVERDRDRPDVLAHLVAVLRDAAAALGQGQNVVVAVHALDLDVLLFAQVVEDLGRDGGVDAQALSKVAERGFALEEGELQHQVDDGVLGDAEVGDFLGQLREETSCAASAGLAAGGFKYACRAHPPWMLATGLQEEYQASP